MKTAEEIYEEIGCNSKKDIIEAMKIYANQKLDEAAEKAQEMIYDRGDTKIADNYQGLVMKNYQICYATAKQSIISLKDKVYESRR